MRVRITSGAILLTAGLILGSTAAAQAGETNGKGQPIPGAQRASSVCAYSGRDLPDGVEHNPPGFDDDDVTGGHVQSYGMYVRAKLKAYVPSPGVECRGNAPSEG